MAQLDKADGTLFMISYRDPNLLATLDVYDGAGDFLLKELDNDIITPKDITRAIIGCIGAIDGAAVPPRSAGWTSFLRYYMNSSTGRRQRWRNSILNAKSHDFQDFASRLKAMKNMTIAVVGAKSEMQSAAVGSGLTFEFLNAY
jgi:Zn-dependent M16 (insulinase) family peptidase